MDRIAGPFDPGIGIVPLGDGGHEIGRANLPASTRILPEAEAARSDALMFGQLSDSALLERFSGYMAVEPRFRELLAPDVFFEALDNAGQAFAGGEGDGNTEEGPLAEAARQVARILQDKTLCDMLRSLILKA